MLVQFRFACQEKIEHASKPLQVLRFMENTSTEDFLTLQNQVFSGLTRLFMLKRTTDVVAQKVSKFISTIGSESNANYQAPFDTHAARQFCFSKQFRCPQLCFEFLILNR